MLVLETVNALNYYQVTGSLKLLYFFLKFVNISNISINYETVCLDVSTIEMSARVNTKKEDRVKIKEIGHLKGKNSTGVLTTRIALGDKSTADVYNELVADGPYARGHVDCKEIVQNKARAKAVSVVEVEN